VRRDAEVEHEGSELRVEQAAHPRVDRVAVGRLRRGLVRAVVDEELVEARVVRELREHDADERREIPEVLGLAHQVAPHDLRGPIELDAGREPQVVRDLADGLGIRHELAEEPAELGGERPGLSDIRVQPDRARRGAAHVTGDGERVAVRALQRAGTGVARGAVEGGEVLGRGRHVVAAGLLVRGDDLAEAAVGLEPLEPALLLDRLDQRVPVVLDEVGLGLRDEREEVADRRADAVQVEVGVRVDAALEGLVQVEGVELLLHPERAGDRDHALVLPPVAQVAPGLAVVVERRGLVDDLLGAGLEHHAALREQDVGLGGEGDHGGVARARLDEAVEELVHGQLLELAAEEARERARERADHAREAAVALGGGGLLGGVGRGGVERVHDVVGVPAAHLHGHERVDVVTAHPGHVRDAVLVEDLDDLGELALGGERPHEKGEQVLGERGGLLDHWDTPCNRLSRRSWLGRASSRDWRSGSRATLTHRERCPTESDSSFFQKEPTFSVG
jgi:hypothetical protein